MGYGAVASRDRTLATAAFIVTALATASTAASPISFPTTSAPDAAAAVAFTNIANALVTNDCASDSATTLPVVSLATAASVSDTFVNAVPSDPALPALVSLSHALFACTPSNAAFIAVAPLTFASTYTASYVTLLPTARAWRPFLSYPGCGSPDGSL